MNKNRKINLILIHCSATRVTQDFTVGELEACHLARGFRDIGYHYYITKDGVIYPCRPESEPGAHARHYNAHSIGICYEGGLDANGRPADTRTLAQKAAMRELLKSLCTDYPEAEISRPQRSPRCPQGVSIFQCQEVAFQHPFPHIIFRSHLSFLPQSYVPAHKVGALS